MLGLGSGKMHNQSQYGGFIGGVRKRLKGSQPDKEPWPWAKGIKTQKVGSGTESNG